MDYEAILRILNNMELSKTWYPTDYDRGERHGYYKAIEEIKRKLDKIQ